MLEEFDKLIIFIGQKYEKMLDEWYKNGNQEKLNLKKIEVRQINDNKKILDDVFEYRLFIIENNIDLIQEIKKLNLKNNVDLRVKLRNSIEYKINNYIQNHEEGKIPINKCLNDILGIRITFKEDINYQVIKEHIETKYKKNTSKIKIRCKDGTKEKAGYVATHIYFKKDNYSFPWELQIWDKQHEQSNIKAHEIYKQDYTKWENEIKGGV